MLHVHSSRPVTSLPVRIEWVLLINQSKMLSLQQVLWNNYYVTLHIRMTFLAMPDHRRARNDLRYSSLLHVLAAATSRQWLLSFWWRVLCKYLVRLIFVHILLHPFISLCVISFHFISFYVGSYHFMSYFKSFHVISYHFISFLSASLYPIWWNHEKWYFLIFVMRATSELYHLHTYASKIFVVD